MSEAVGVYTDHESTHDSTGYDKERTEETRHCSNDKGEASPHNIDANDFARCKLILEWHGSNSD